MTDSIEALIRAIVRDEVARALAANARFAEKPTPTLPPRAALNSREAAEYCGIRGGAQVLRNLKSQGSGPKVHKRGGRLYYLVSELDAWMQE